MQNLNLVHLSYLTLCALSDGVIIANSKGQVLFLNKVAERLTGWDIERAKGKFLKDVFIVYHEDGQTRYMPSLVVGLQQMDLPDYLVFRNQAGHIQCYITGTVTHFTDEEIMFSGFVLLFHDVSYLKQRESQIQYDFFHDTLTGLFNRAFFDVEVERLSGERMLPLSVIIADANGLKLVNDVFGHHEGDKLLQKIAKVLRSACRHEDIIARTGGDEFIILLPQVNREEAQAIVDRISRSCNEVEVSPIPLSVSVGTATRENKEDSINSIIELAEERMYTAKLRENSMVRDEMSKFIRKTLETHAGETAEHGKRLKDMSVEMAKRIGLDDYDRIQLELLAMVHDIGKIAIPKSILSKPGSLELDEWHTVQKHSEIGYRIVIYFPEMAILSTAILGHHERWDGKGYPQGLKGKQIPINSRILAIADAYDVLTCGSPYKVPVSSSEALKEIQRCSGTQFDPELVELFTEIIEGTADKAQ